MAERHKHRWKAVAIEQYECTCGAQLKGMVVWDHYLLRPCDCAICSDKDEAAGSTQEDQPDA